MLSIIFCDLRSPILYVSADFLFTYKDLIYICLRVGGWGWDGGITFILIYSFEGILLYKFVKLLYFGLVGNDYVSILST